MKTRIHAADAASAEIVSQAVRFEIALFAGRGKYIKAFAKTLDEARRQAKRLEREHRNGKRALIYAVTKAGRSAPITDAILKAMEAAAMKATPTKTQATKTEAMKTYSKKFNAQRAAKRAGLDPAEIEIIKREGGFSWQRKLVQAVAQAPSLAASSELEAPARPKRRVRYVELEAAAQKGEMPPVPDFGAPTHARFRGKLKTLIALAEASDIAALEAIEINPVSTSPKAMKRYRDLCVIALKARAQQACAG